MKARLLAFYEQTNALNFEVFGQMLSPDFVNHGVAGFPDLHGPAEFRALYERFLGGMPDLHFDPIFMVAEGDIVFLRGTLSGTHTGNLMGMAPPTHKRLAWTGTSVYRFDDQGVITARWEEWDVMGMMQQAGVIPTPPGQESVGASTRPEPQPTATDTDPARIQQNRALMQRFTEEVWNRKRLDVADEVFAPTATSPDAAMLPPCPAGVKVIAEMFFEAFPDFHMEIDFLAAEGDRVAAHFVQCGTHQGPLFGIPATGRTVKFGEMGILRLEHGQVVESFYNTDMMGLMQQLGVAGGNGASG